MYKVRRFVKRCWLALVQAVVLALLVLSTLGAYAESVPGNAVDEMFYAKSRVYQPGQLVDLPVRHGNYLMLLWGGSPLWFDAKDEWFHFEAIRNYTTHAQFQIPRLVEVGDYQLLEIEAIGDPYDLNNWRWTRGNNIRIQRCDGFTLCF